MITSDAKNIYCNNCDDKQAKSRPLITPYIQRRPAEALVGVTRCLDIKTYLAECENRQARGWSPHRGQTLKQMLAAYRAGLSPYKPGPGEIGRELFDEVDLERTVPPLSRVEQEQLIVTLEQDERFRSAVRNLVVGGLS